MLRDFGIVTVVDLTVSLIGVLLVLPAALLWAEEHGPITLRDFDPRRVARGLWAERPRGLPRPRRERRPFPDLGRPAWGAGAERVSDEDPFADLGKGTASAPAPRRSATSWPSATASTPEPPRRPESPAPGEQVRLGCGDRALHGIVSVFL